MKLNVVDEIRVVEENDAFLRESEAIGDHCAVINATLVLLNHFFNVRVANTADESSLIGLGARVYNSSAAALYLTRSGYYQTALMLLRDLIESTNLLDYFLTHKSDIVKWRTLPAKQRRKLFDPAPIRDALQARDQLPRDLRKEYYAELSEVAVHATFRGVNLLARDGKRMVGPFADRERVEGVLSFLPLLTTFGAQAFLKHFEDVEDPDYLRALVAYNGIFMAWQKKHHPNAVFREEQ